MYESEWSEFQDKQVFGTPAYIAPEVIIKQGYGNYLGYILMRNA